jgi:6-phosphogluconolactonase/glucosamine-6-phosphate isomerase/deaminase
MPAYRQVASGPIRHDDRLHVLFSDDRYVPEDSEESNYHQSRALLDVLGLPPESLLRVHPQLPLEAAAADYQEQLSGMLSSGVKIGLGLLGLGADGHTASLFTPQDLERSRGHYAIAVQRPDGLAGVSVTPELLATVGELLFVVAGNGKEAALAALMAKDLKLTAWKAVQGLDAVGLWVEQAALG